MRNTLKTFALFGAIFLLAAGFGFGQTNTVASTYLAAAVSGSLSASTVIVGSATGITVSPQTLLFVDQERMPVVSVNGTSITVSRTNPGAHAQYSRVYIGRPNWFYSVNPPARGACTLANLYAHPWINVNTGAIWSCVGGIWTHENALPATSGRPQYWTIPLGSAAYASTGTDTAITATTVYVGELFVPRSMLVTGIKALAGGTVAGTDTGIAFLFNANGQLLANSALAGTTLTGINTVQTLPLTAPYFVNGPARYWIGVQVSAATTKIRTVATSTFTDLLSTTITSVTYGTLPTFSTLPTTFTADNAPIAGVY